MELEASFEEEKHCSSGGQESEERAAEVTEKTESKKVEVDDKGEKNVDETKEDDPYFYTKRNEFTSEIYKIEIGNLPNYIGYGQLKKFLKNKIRLNPHKIKAFGPQSKFVFVSFRCEEEREKALKLLNGYIYKGKPLYAKKANPVADPLVKKRKIGECEENETVKKQCVEVSVSERVKNGVIAWWNVPYEEQLQRKEEEMKKIIIKLTRKLEFLNTDLKTWIQDQRKKYFAGCCLLEPILRSPECDKYRNKNEFSVGRHLETEERTVGFRIGLYKSGSKSVAEPDELVHIPDEAKQVAKAFQSYVRSSEKDVFNAETHEGYWRQLTVRTTRTGEIMAVVVIHPQNLTEEEVKKEKASLCECFENGPAKDCGVTSLYLQRFAKKLKEGEEPPFEHIFGSKTIEEVVLGLKFQISPNAFFQVNTLAAEVLFDAVANIAGLTSSTTVLDIFCGTGTIGLCLAKKVEKVIGAESCSEAVENARKNAEINGITNATFICGRAEDVIYSLLSEAKDSEDIVAIVDPPRMGLHRKVLQALRANEKLRKIVYISCNPNLALTNFADFGRQPSNNYKGTPFVPVKAVPVDLFPYTPHCELVIVFERFTKERKI